MMKLRQFSPSPAVLSITQKPNREYWPQIGLLSVLLCLLFFAQNAQATLIMLDKQAKLRVGHPQQYRVKAGDSLWDVMGLFVEKPHKMHSSVWHNTKIYPGNTVTLVERAGHPALQVQRGNRVVKLSPGIITSRAERAIPKIPLSSVRQFLSHPEIVEADELSDAPYIVANANDKLLTTANDIVYARGMDGMETLGEIYVILRPSEAYMNPDEDDDEPLAFGALYLGEATLEALDEDDENNVATFKVNVAKQEIRPGDRLMPLPEREFEQDFLPSEPYDIEGTKIIGVTNDTTHIGQYQVVVLNRGEQDGISRGNILSVYHSGSKAEDPVTGEAVTLPDIKSGSLLVFKVYERVSFALVSQATRPIYVNDRVDVP